MPSLKYNQVTKSDVIFGYVRKYDVSTGEETVVPITLPLEMNQYLQVAVVGASLMEQATNTSVNRDVINDQLISNGFTSEVHDRATTGDTSGALLTKLQNGLLDRFLEVADRTLVLLHIGGNDVSSSIPEATLNSNLRAIYDFILDAGFTLVPSPISYRTNPTVDASGVYNTNVVLPAITEIKPEWIPEGVPIFDMYKLVEDNPSYLIDGIHLTEAGKTAHRNLMASVIIDNVNVKVEADSTYAKEIYANFGGGSPEVAGSFINITTSTTALTENTDGSTITSAVQVTTSGSDGTYSTGRADQEINVAPSPYNNTTLLNGIYTDSTPITIDLTQAGINSSALYTVKLSASRDTTSTDRIGEYTVGGVTQELDAIANPVEVLTFTNVTGADLLASGVVIARKSGSGFAYLSNLLITEQ